jgi:hypothetical protein
MDNSGDRFVVDEPMHRQPPNPKPWNRRGRMSAAAAEWDRNKVQSARLRP